MRDKSMINPALTWLIMKCLKNPGYKGIINSNIQDRYRIKMDIERFLTEIGAESYFIFDCKNFNYMFTNKSIIKILSLNKMNASDKLLGDVYDIIIFHETVKMDSEVSEICKSRIK